MWEVRDLIKLGGGVDKVDRVDRVNKVGKIVPELQNQKKLAFFLMYTACELREILKDF